MEYTYKVRQEIPDTESEELARYELEVFGTTKYADQLKDTLPIVISRYMEEAKIGTNKLSRLTGIPLLPSRRKRLRRRSQPTSTGRSSVTNTI